MAEIHSVISWFSIFSITIPGCVSSPCQNGASCAKELDFGSYECYCTNGFTGTNCERFEGTRKNYIIIM